MIRITEIGDGSKWHLLVEGALSDGWVDALETSWLQAQLHLQANRKCLCIDLSGVTYIDDKGRDLLARIIRGGAELRTAGIMSRTVVEEIRKEIEDQGIK